jgi:hypothetical protein
VSDALAAGIHNLGRKFVTRPRNFAYGELDAAQQSIQSVSELQQIVNTFLNVQGFPTSRPIAAVGIYLYILDVDVYFFSLSRSV